MSDQSHPARPRAEKCWQGPPLIRRLTAALRPLPAFVVIGAQKAGTTTLFGHLRRHPLIAPPHRKEVHYFDLNFDKGLSWYRGFYPTWARMRRLGAQITGEASPYYLFHPLAASRMAQVLPNAKVIVLLRNPVARAYSHYHHQRGLGDETLSFEEAIEQEEARLRGEEDKILSDANYYSENHHKFAYLARGVYADQLQRWLQSFPREQMLILKSEDFFADPAATLGRVYEFLGLPYEPPRSRKKRLAGSYPPMNPDTGARLLDYFAPHNRRLEELLGEKFDWSH